LKIGVFGDSFASRDRSPMWWQMLAQYGHEVESWGESGSSIEWSVELIQRYHGRYEFMIWCVSMPGRLSLRSTIGPPYQPRWEHWRVSDAIVTRDPEVRRRQEIYRDYYLEFFPQGQDQFQLQALVHYVQHLHPNIMIVPCFRVPLDTEFNLYEASLHEVAPCFDTPENLHDWYQHYEDKRPGHFTPENHAVLAELINQNLRPGVFCTDYGRFHQVQDLATVFSRRH
jgi:hypothetical protein